MRASPCAIRLRRHEGANRLRRSSAVVLISGALAGLSASMASAQVFRWEDPDGNRHYTDAPPPDRAAVSNFKQLADKPARIPMPKKLARPKREPAPTVTGEDKALAGRIAELERALAAERAARQLIDTQAQASMAAFEQQMAAQQKPAIPYVSGIVFTPAPDYRPRRGHRPESSCGRAPLPPCGARLDAAPIATPTMSSRSQHPQRVH